MLHTESIAGETLQMHPWGALFWEARGMLLLSDVHLGKVTHFRKFGAAVPLQALKRNFKRLQTLTESFEPQQICFLGDLFHSHMNREWAYFEAWARSCPSKLLLVEGNHDIISPLRYEALGIQLVPELQAGPFTLTHHPDLREDGFNICGHIHPAVRLGGRGRQQLRLPCFFLRERQLILPAFGAFTGTHAMDPEPGDRIFTLADGRVVPLDAVIP